nr:hypothetical protein [Tanacetum cinerariifolium]
NIQKIAFVSSQNIKSTNESVSVVPSIFDVSTKAPASFLPNVDNLSYAVIYSFFARDGSQVANGHAYHKSQEVSLKDWKESSVMELVAMIGAFRLMKDQQIMPSWHLPPPAHPVLQVLIVRDNALVELRKKFEKAKKERNELKLTLENLQTSSKNPMFDCDELNSSELDESMPTSPVHDRYKSGEGYHVVPPLYTGTFMPPKPDLVFHDAHTASETILNVFNDEPNTTKPTKELSQSNRPFTPIIED